MAARDTRETKRHTPVAELLPRWHAEIVEAGSSVAGVNRTVDAAAAERGRPPACLGPRQVERLVAEALSPDGRLAERKVFTRRDVIVALAPQLYGLDPAELPRLVDRVVASPEAVPLIGVAGARERAYAPVSVLATEAAIATVVEAGAERTDAATPPLPAVHQAMWSAERRLGRRRTGVRATRSSGSAPTAGAWTWWSGWLGRARRR